MGKKNPIKQAIRAATDLAVAPIRETARIVGADGVVKGMDDIKDFGNALGTGAIDLANNEKNKQKKKSDGFREQAETQARGEAETASRNQAAAENSRIEDERMSAGSKSRTLLTGPSGLEDEDVSISRKTLKGMR